MRRDQAEGELRHLREAIGTWRRTREKRTVMPADLWARAVALAHARGTYAVARALRVDYESLARRVAEARGGQAAAPGFVELRGADLFGGGTVVEVSEPDGARMTVRLGAGAALDAAAVLVGAFRRRA